MQMAMNLIGSVINGSVFQWQKRRLINCAAANANNTNMTGAIAPNSLRAAQLSKRSCCTSSPRSMVIVASSNKQVTLLDYGAGNVCSVRNAIKKLGYSIKDVRPEPAAPILWRKR